MHRARRISAAASHATRALGTIIVVLLLGAAPELAAQDGDPGRFEIRSARAELDAGVYYIDARVELRLPAEAREALRAGVPLTIRFDVEMTYRRRWWMDSDVAELQQRYQLDYHALTERFIVSNPNSGDSSSFSTLFSALNALGRIERLPLIDASLLEADRAYDVRMRVVLDTERFSGPLRLFAFWRRDFAIASDWYEWRLDEA